METIPLGELALRYLPWCSSRHEAVIRFARWVKGNEKLRQRLAELNYRPGQILVTPLQHQAFIDFLGEP
jgi:hypothetical protein